jgi:hypothetical protein
MSIISAAYWRDANSVPITDDGIVSLKSLSLIANNTTLATPLFRITGSVEVRGLWGIVTTVLSSAVTVAFWRLNDQTAQPAITLATGTTISAAPVGSLIVKTGLAAAALTLKSSAAGAIVEPTTLETLLHSPFALTQKTGGINSDIEFVYTTTNAPATGAIQFFMRWLPLSSDANVVPQ